MSDGRWTLDGRRRIHAIAAVATAACVLIIGAVVIHSWVDRNRLIEGQGYQGVVFSQVHAACILGPMLSSDANGYWTPTEADIQALERELTAAAQTNHPEGLHSLDAYRRQYFGYSRDGRRKILVIGFCDANGLDWTEAFVSAGEGGCHFEATYDVMQDAVSGLWALDTPEHSGSGESATAGKWGWALK